MEQEPTPIPLKRLSAAARTVVKAFPGRPTVSEYEILGWEDGSFRIRLIGPNGAPLNRDAVIGVSAAEGASDAAVRAAVAAAIAREP